MMTLEQFRATRRPTRNLAINLPDGAAYGAPCSPGFIYTGDCYIAQDGDDSRHTLTIYNESWTASTPAELADLERRLYEWARDEGVLDDAPKAPAPVDVLAARWIAELAAHPNGMHEIRGGAVNARERPLVAFAASYELAKAIADAHNCSAAVAELIESLEQPRIRQVGCSHHTCASMRNAGPNAVLCESCAQWNRLRAALARCKGEQA